MKISDLSAFLELRVLSGDPCREYDGVYSGDFLSRAMSRVKADNLWITIMNNPNVIAVASLTDAAAVILAEGVTLLPDAQNAAGKKDVCVLTSPLSAYELCVRIHELQKSHAGV